MKIDISKKTFDRVENVLGGVLTDEVINRGIDIITQTGLKFTTPNKPKDKFDRLEWTRIMKGSTINGISVIRLLHDRYGNGFKLSWNSVMGEVVNMSAKTGMDREQIEKIFGINLEDGLHEENHIYIESLNASFRKQDMPICARIMAKGGERLPFSVHIKYRRNKDTYEGKIGDKGEFKVNC